MTAPVTIQSHEDTLHSTKRFHDLFYAHRSGILHHLGAMLGHDQQMVENASQEVWLKVWRALIRDDGRAPETVCWSWLARIAHNVAIDELRRRYVQRGSGHASTGELRPVAWSLENHWAAAEQIVDEGEDALSPEALLIHREEMADLYARIPTRYREIIELRVSGMTRREIAAKYPYTPEQIRYALDRRLKRRSGVAEQYYPIEDDDDENEKERVS